MAVAKVIYDGVTKIDLTSDTVASSNLVSGYTATGADGEQVQGALTSNTSSDLIVSGATVTVPSGYYPDAASVTIPSTTHTTPTISIGSDGLVTATHTQTAGYVAAGTTSSTYQMSTRGASTYTPTTSNITIPGGTYLTGDQTILGDSNLVAENIANGVSIFGVQGTLDISSHTFNFQTKTAYPHDESYVVNPDTDLLFLICRISFSDGSLRLSNDSPDTLANSLNSVRVGDTVVITGQVYGLNNGTPGSYCSITHSFVYTGSSHTFKTTPDWWTFTINPGGSTKLSWSSKTSSVGYIYSSGDICIYVIRGYDAISELTLIGTESNNNIAGLIDGSIGEIRDDSTTITDYKMDNYQSLSYVSIPLCTTIGQYAFRGCCMLQEIYTPEVITVGSMAFNQCRALSHIELPKCTTINQYAFYHCNNLQSVSIPVCTTMGDGVFSACDIPELYAPEVTAIRAYCFYSCHKLSSVNFPKCKTISAYAFKDLANLETISFPQCSLIDNSQAFLNCTKLKSASFPECLWIGMHAFAGCTALSEIYFPKNTFINTGAFSYCQKLVSASFPMVSGVMSWAFSNCASLTTAYFPICTHISQYAFYFCTKLSSIYFPELFSIGSSAFYACSSITVASFPKLSIVYTSAFYHCFNLVSLYLLGSSVATLNGAGWFTSTPIGGYSGSAGTYGTIFVPESLYDAYVSATGWSNFSSLIVGLTDAQIAAL